MRVAVPRETTAGERRVALVPENVSRLVKQGHAVRVQRGAGVAAGYPDAAYEAAGATLADGHAAAVEGAEVVARVRAPDSGEVDELPRGALLVALLGSQPDAALLEQLARRGVDALAMERVPRTTRAQAMDALSSQATLAGYEAVLLGAASLPRILPMMTTAAGTLAPAKAFVVGAGVAGLQAIATARRLGAVVSAFDVRPVVKEQVQSLGASFVEVAQVVAEGQGGYAKELGASEQERVLAAIGAHVKEMDLVVTTAQIPGPPRATPDHGRDDPHDAPGLGRRGPRGRDGRELRAHPRRRAGGRGGGVDRRGGRPPLLGPAAREPAVRPERRDPPAAPRADGKLALDPQDDVAGPMRVVHAGKVIT